MLRLAKRRKADLEELEADDGYHMPDTYDGDQPRQSDRYKLLSERYRCGRECLGLAILGFCISLGFLYR